jgi:hypothetical protein
MTSPAKPCQNARSIGCVLAQTLNRIANASRERAPDDGLRDASDRIYGPDLVQSFRFFSSIEKIAPAVT